MRVEREEQTALPPVKKITVPYGNNALTLTNSEATPWAVLEIPPAVSNAQPKAPMRADELRDLARAATMMAERLEADE